MEPSPAPVIGAAATEPGYRQRRWAFLAVGLLAGCSATPKGPPDDPALTRLDHAGGIAFNLEQPEQAVTQYRAALDRAHVRDDGSAIADAGFNLATSQLRAGDPAAALDTVRQIQTELARRGVADAGFGLITATAEFRLHDLAAADATAAALTGAADPALANAAWFLRGLIADMRGDAPGLAQAAAALTPAADPADITELRARLTHDSTLALIAADKRRDALDYRGMARCLALAADFTPDPARSADLYLRAGRSAAASHDPDDARAWFQAAGARDVSLRVDMDRALHHLPAP
jgi:tetratricopeptide (TPR) repeat protein